jgi:hypothetical protein
VLHLSLVYNSSGVFENLVQGVQTEGGLCEFECAQQRDQSLGFGFSSYIETWLQVLRHGVFKSLAQAARIEGRVCEFACTTTTPMITIPTPTTTKTTSTALTSHCNLVMI